MHEFSKLNKQIYYVKVIVWEACPLRCKYCFVDKTNKTMIETVKMERLIELLLYTPWHHKLLHLLGGEPLIYFDIIKHAVIYARKLEKETGKQLDISFCTSGIGFTEEKIQFIRDHDIYLAWSIDGTEEVHNRNRIFGTGKGSYDAVTTYKQEVVSNIKSTHLGIAMTVDENTVEDMYDSYIYLTKDMGFDCTVNIAPVDGKRWSKKAQKAWVEWLVQVYDHVFAEIAKWHSLYLNAFNKEFRFNMITRKNEWRCLWFYVEAFTNGAILFNPFVNKEEDYSQYVVGNIGDDNFITQVKKYWDCKFDNNSKSCSDCRKSYYQSPKKQLKVVEMNNLLSYRDRITEYYANKMRVLAKTNTFYQDYIDTSKDYMYV